MRKYKNHALGGKRQLGQMKMMAIELVINRYLNLLKLPLANENLAVVTGSVVGFNSYHGLILEL